MKPGHLFAALVLASGVGQHAFAEEPKKPEAQQEAQQQQPAPRDTVEEASTATARKAAQAESAASATPAGTSTGASAGAILPAASSDAPGAASAPSSVKAEAAGSHAAQANWTDSFFGEVKVTDVLLALFTGLLVVLGYIQARRMREAVSAAKESAAVAEKSARVAEDALISGQRAFMFIREIKTYLHEDPATGMYRWSIHPVWANSGNTPTRSLSINTTYRLLDQPLPDNYSFPESREDLIPTIAGPRSMVEATPGSLSSEDLEAVKSGKKYFYIWGWAEYHDIFEGTKKRVTRFCNQLIQVDGDPKTPMNEHNPVQMMFGFHADNNYAD